MNQTTDMTEGRPLKHFMLFALPMVVSNLLQELYYITDSVIVGRMIGVKAFAAIGAAGFYYWLALGVVFGFAHGFGALFAQRFGAKDFAGLKRAIAQSVMLSAVFSALLTAAFLLLLRPMLEAVNTPADIIGGAHTYLLWIFAALPVMFAYNISGSVLRALGNSRTPLVSILISTVVNIALDILFVGPFGMGVEGVAIATAIAQCCALAFCLIKLRAIEAARIGRRDFKDGRAEAFSLVKLGGPLAFRNMVIEVGGLLVQYVINGYGTLYVAGIAAAYKYLGIMNIVGFSLDGATAVFVGQNYGARKAGRIKQGVHTALMIGIVSSVITAALTILFGREMIMLFIEGDAAEVAAVAAIGYNNLLAVSVCLPFLYLLFIYRSALQGMGNSPIPMASGFVEMIMRVIAVFIMPAFVGVWGVYFSIGIGWVAAAVLLIIGFYVVYKKRFAGEFGCELSYERL